MYIYVRMVFVGILAFAFWMLMRKRALRRKRLVCGIAALTAGVLYAALTFLPLENALFSFDTPQAAYTYYTFEKPNTALLVKGDRCDLLIDRQGNTDTLALVRKNEDGWKVGLGIDLQNMTYLMAEDFSIHVYRCRGTDDYFVHIVDNVGGITLSDGRGTDFVLLEREESPYEQPIKGDYYGYVSGLDEQYCVAVNGTPYYLLKREK